MHELYHVLEQVSLPRMVKVAQKFDDTHITDLPEALHQSFLATDVLSTIHPGMRIAITAGSRGIANIDIILREVANAVRQQGGEPFLVPAMGSHGGGTAEGQTHVLEELHITSDICPIHSSMDVVEIAQTPEGFPVYLDRYAHEADGIIVVGRVKPHTCFRGEHESGLLKMMTIGLGKREGAALCHSQGWSDMAHRIPEIAKTMLAHSNILFAVATVENAYDQTCVLEAIPKEHIVSRDAQLLELAKEKLGKIYLPQSDVLIVDYIGKDISGDGADPNVTGAFATPYASGGHQTQNIAFLDLTERTRGSAAGIGVAQATTRRLFEKLDLPSTYINALTSTVLNCVRIPAIFESDRAAIAACISTCTKVDKSNIRIVRIKNTMELGEIYVSEALLPQVALHPNLTVLSASEPFAFDEYGNLW